MTVSNAAEALTLAMRLREEGRPAEAEQLVAEVLRIVPDHPAPLSIQALLACELGRLDEAAALAERVLTFDPGNIPALVTQAHCAHRQGRTDDAEKICHRIIAVAPDNEDAHFILGALAQQAGNREKAAEAYRRVLDVQPDHFHALNNLGVTLGNGAPEAGRLFQRAVAARPQAPEGHYNLGNALAARDAYDAALSCYGEAIALKPDYVEAYINLGVALRNLGRLDEAELVYRRAIDMVPDSAEAHFNLSQVLLLQGDFAAAWPEYEWRLKAPAQFRRQQSFAQPFWQGEDLSGKTILVHVEQGLGDVIQMVRFVPMLAALGARVVLEVQPALVELMRSLDGVATVVAHGDALPEFDIQVPVMSLAGCLGVTADTIPAPHSYLAADPAKVAAWRSRIGSDGVTVGLVWAGSPTHQMDRLRSIPAPILLPRLMLPGVRLFSLQKEPRGGEADYLAALGGAVTDLGPDLHDFTDTAAAMAALDLIISVDSSPAHLAGALGRPVWLLTPFAPDWRWMLEGDDSPWYPTMRVFRQEEPGSWEDALTHVALSLQHLARNATAAST